MASRPAALALEVTSQNERARALYERLGFRGKNLAMRRLVVDMTSNRARHYELARDQVVS